VDIRLAVRSICCLRPGIPGLSDRIQVRAVIDRFLEHKRVFMFANGGNEEVYLSSADWMPRNFHRRVEVLVPLLDPAIRARTAEILGTLMADNVKSWELHADGSYAKVTPQAGAAPVRSQYRAIELARERVKHSDPLSRGGRFHILAVPKGPEEEQRRAKNAKKKKGTALI
jgi:polyphosphate kinase